MIGIEPEPMLALPLDAVLAITAADVVRVSGKGVFAAGPTLHLVRVGDRVAIGGAHGYFIGRVGAVQADYRQADRVLTGQFAGLYLAMSSNSPVESGSSVYLLGCEQKHAEPGAAADGGA